MMIDWTQIDTVLLDMDGTLLDLHFDNYFWLTYLPARYAALNNLPIEAAEARLHQEIKHHEGTLAWYCLDFWSERLGIDIVALTHEVKDRIALRPQAMEFLQLLGELGKERVLITNAHRGSLNLKLQETSLAFGVDRVISSHDYQAPKEDLKFWEALEDDLKFLPARTLFIDDTARILAKAAEYGIGHVLGIHQPDSKISRQMTEYPAIWDFAEIMPSTSNL